MVRWEKCQMLVFQRDCSGAEYSVRERGEFVEEGLRLEERGVWLAGRFSRRV